MRTERDVLKDPLTRTSQRRKTLSNITNLSLSASWAPDAREGLKAKTPSSKTISFTESQLREENTALKRSLSEKDGTIESQAAQLDQMQKEFFAQLRRHSQVNEELISYNSRLSKDVGQLRDQLKLLQHEYSQMTVAYRVNQSELQVKVTESQELITRLLLEQGNKSATEQCIPYKGPKKPRSISVPRRHSIANIVIEEDWKDSTKVDDDRSQDGVKRTDSSRRSVSKETRQTQQRADDQPAAAPARTPNLYCDLIGLDPMPEGSCEDDTDSPRESTSEEASSIASDDFCTGGKSRSGLTSESTSRRPKSGCSESTPAFGKRAGGSGSGRKSEQRVSSTSSGSGTVSSSSTAGPHFSRRVAINSSLSTENGRPLRRAVVKVASYTEPALNTKMRRPS
ncbi:unnamed protein product [Calypogeia fissa]